MSSSTSLIIPLLYNKAKHIHRNRRIRRGFSCNFSRPASNGRFSSTRSAISPRNTFLWDPWDSLFGLNSQLPPLELDREILPKYGSHGELIRNVPCPNCRGRGYVQCPACHGLGSDSCHNCDSQGIVKCASCKGDRTVNQSSLSEILSQPLSLNEELTVADDEMIEQSIQMPLPRARRKYSPLPESVKEKIRATLKMREERTKAAARRLERARGDPVTWERWMAKIRKTKQSSEYRERLSVIMKAYYSNDENRSRHLSLLKGRVFRCRSCQAEDHRTGDCPLRERKASLQLYRCSHCRELGTHRKNCCPHKHLPPVVVEKPLVSRKMYQCGICQCHGHNARSCKLRVRGV